MSMDRTKIDTSLMPGFFKLSVPERLDALKAKERLSDFEIDELLKQEQVLTANSADKMIENVIGVFSLPLSVAPNFLINDKDYIVPLAVEEPSIVAALSFAAKKVRAGGGFQVDPVKPVLIGQIQIMGVQNTEASIAALQNDKTIVPTVNPAEKKATFEPVRVVKEMSQ